MTTEPRRLLSDVAYENVRTDIIACELPPGMELTETDFRERYDLTIATTRAALTRLSQEGLIRSEPRRGYVVSEITLRDVIEIFDLRIIIEPGVTRAATRLLSDATLRRLEMLAEEGCDPDVIADRAKWLANNRAFHIAVAEATGNMRAVAAVSRLIDESQRVLHLALGRLDLSERFGDEHRDLVQLMAAGQADAAAEMTRTQIADGKDWVVNAILSSNELLDRNLSSLS